MLKDKIGNTIAWIMGDLFLIMSGIIDFSVITLETIFFGILGGASAVLGRKLIEYIIGKFTK